MTFTLFLYFLIYFLDVNVYPSIYFSETFFYVPFYFIFVIKLGSILTLRNMFVIFVKFIFFLLYFLLHTHFLHEEKSVK
jgi:hypothetical protein